MGMSAERLRLYEWLMEQEGRPYLYGAKGELYRAEDGHVEPAYDCSGLVTCGLLHCGGPDWRQTHNAAHLFAELPEVEEPEDLLPMDLAFYGDLNDKLEVHINHVMLLWGDGRVYGACGGTSKTLTLVQASLRDAKVQFRPRVNYRIQRDFRGYRRLPLP